MAIFATQSPAAGETGLGWSTGQSAAETNSRLNSILNALGPSDKLVFRGKYNHAGTITNTRSNLNIEGGGVDKGLHITDPIASSADVLTFTGERVTISDLTITAEAGFHQGRSLIRSSGRYFTFQYGKLDADLGYLIEIYGDDALVQRNEFSNLSGWAAGRSPNSKATAIFRPMSAKRWRFLFNYSHHVPHEHIKTGANQATNEMPVVEDNHAFNLRRDFLDTTGGFYGLGPTQRAKLNRNVVKNGAILIDAKFEGGQIDSYPIGGSHTKYVEITGNKLVNCSNFIVSTITDAHDPPKFVSTSPGDFYWRDAITEDLLCSDNSLEAVWSHAVLVKHGLRIVLSNTKKYGSVSATRVFSETEMASTGTSPVSAAVAAAIYDYAEALNPGNPKAVFLTETGSTFQSGSMNIPDAPTFAYGPRSGVANPSADPLFVLAGSTHRTNTDLGALSARTIMAGVENANGAASDSYTVTVS